MLPIALSPCPNDTFLFHAWIHGLVGKKLPPAPTFGDIEELNRWALERKFPLIKVSLALLPAIEDDYILLPVGAALGWGVGPLLLAKEPFPLSDIPSKKVALPGSRTTANALFKALLPAPAATVFCLYHEMYSLLDSGEVDAAVVIHESRFTYDSLGFTLLADLGKLWEDRFSLPTPLGGLVIRRDFPPKLVDCLTRILRESLWAAWSNPLTCRSFVMELAQEKDPEVTERHIDLYVTKESERLSHIGYRAIDKLRRTS